MQELMQSPWRITAYWPASFPWLDLIYYMLRTTYTGVVPPVVGWTFSHRSLIKQTSYRLAYKPIIKTFPKLKLLLPDNSGLCQVTKTLASKGPDKVTEQQTYCLYREAIPWPLPTETEHLAGCVWGSLCCLPVKQASAGRRGGKLLKASAVFPTHKRANLRDDILKTLYSIIHTKEYPLKL